MRFNKQEFIAKIHLIISVSIVVPVSFYYGFQFGTIAELFIGFYGFWILNSHNCKNYIDNYKKS
ncbi:hypothetical protein ES674_02650 [Bizionia myxarmorum]|uniref:Uncharacterized protein n=1 Tax=Bizionia myxarmorum TaxID=291186 RepID=A0A5D0RB14_9FLAO|nr:hypothetical protein [Bizionia myxarmorum]TYB78697.1 hypothetical protein ES674_02650 [Bizionia myxarmorum]